MMSAASFVPGIQVGSSSFRRPRVHVCHCFSSQLQVQPWTNQVRPVQMKMSNDQSDERESTAFNLQTNSDSFISSPQRGFALRDAPTISFSDLNTNMESLSTGGAYAISDETGEVVYMGYSKNIASKLMFHSKLVPDKCASFRVYVPPVPPELISADMLENVLEYWVRETGSLPEGNTVDRELWEQEDKEKRKTQTSNSVNNGDTNIHSENNIPIRDRTTPRRVSTRKNTTQYYGQPKTSFGETFQETTNNTRRTRTPFVSNVSDSDEEYVEVDVDPFDPFSASQPRPNFGVKWDAPNITDDQSQQEWFPIFILMGTAGLVWLCGIITSGITASNPSLGM